MDYFDQPSRKATGSSYIVWVVLGVIGFLGMVVTIAGLAVAIYVWQPFRVKQLPPREQELAEERREEAVAAFGGSTVVADEKELAEIRSVFIELGRAFRDKNEDHLRQLLDMERMYQEVRRLGAYTGLSLKDERGVISGMGTGLSRSLAAQGDLIGYERFEIKHCKLNPQRDEAVAYVRTWDSNGVGHKWRWWLKETAGRWRIYDFEDMSTCLRASNLMAATAEIIQRSPSLLPRMQAQLENYRETARAIVAQDFDRARQLLGVLEPEALPREAQAVCAMFQAIVCMNDGRPLEALEACDRAEGLHSSMAILHVVRARVLNALGRHAEAKQAAETYIEELSGDADAYLHLGDALAGLGQRQPAAEAYRQGLDDDCNSVDNLFGLGQVLPAGGKQEVGTRFAVMMRPAEQFKRLCDAFWAEDEFECVETLVAAYAPVAQDDPWLPYYDALLK